jgi:hypothetical protein
MEATDYEPYEPYEYDAGEEEEQARVCALALFVHASRKR